MPQKLVHKEEQILTRFSDHKHSVRFNGDGGPNNITNAIYVRKDLITPRVREIRITIEVFEEER